MKEHLHDILAKHPAASSVPGGRLLYPEVPRIWIMPGPKGLLNAEFSRE